MIGWDLMKLMKMNENLSLSLSLSLHSIFCELLSLASLLIRFEIIRPLFLFSSSILCVLNDDGSLSLLSSSKSF